MHWRVGVAVQGAGRGLGVGGTGPGGRSAPTRLAGATRAPAPRQAGFTLSLHLILCPQGRTLSEDGDRHRRWLSLPASLPEVLLGRAGMATLGPGQGRRVEAHADPLLVPGPRPGYSRPAPTWLVPQRPWDPSPPSGGRRPHTGPAESRSFRTPGPPRRGACSVRTAWKVFWNTGIWSLEACEQRRRERAAPSLAVPHPKSPPLLSFPEGDKGLY